MLWDAFPPYRSRRPSRHDRKDRAEANNDAAPVAGWLCDLAEVFAHDLAGPSAAAGIGPLYARGARRVYLRSIAIWFSVGACRSGAMKSPADRNAGSLTVRGRLSRI